MSTQNEIRVRFAPSPTGFLHIGGTRTALFNWLFAKANNGKFLLRIEDTDPTRSEAKFTEDILESLSWLGLNWDEDIAYQSRRFDVYHHIAKGLLDEDKAYYCECKPEKLDAIRKECETKRIPFRYPGFCRDKKLKAEGATLRLKMPKTGETEFTDLIRGKITIPHKEMDDWILLRADSSPTYNFSVVVDDHFQRISHVLRGEDHINNTPKQILLYRALNYPVPQFAHLPMILGMDRSKLSKRHGAASTLEYRKMGYLPIVLINFLVRLGWSYGDKEIFTLKELTSVFNLEHIGKSNAIFNPEKLNWVSGQILKDEPSVYLFRYLKQYFPEEVAFFDRHLEEKAIAAVDIIKGKVKTLPELIEQLTVLLGTPPSFSKDSISGEKHAQTVKYLPLVIECLSNSTFTKDDLEHQIKKLAESHAEKAPVLSQVIRFGVTGGRVSPGLYDMLTVMGKEEVLNRLHACRASI